MTTLRRIIHQPDPRKQETVKAWTRKLRIGAIALLVGAILWAMSGCSNYAVTAKIKTPYGSISSDGKRVTVEADTRGFAK